MTKDSILGSLLFFIYINNLCVGIKYSEMHQFADDTNLLNFKSCVKSITKQVNYDLKNFVIWFKANKIPLNVGKLNLCFLLNQINNLTEI